MNDLGILDLLGLFGPLGHATTKLVRHEDPRVDLHELQRRGWLDAYQAFQSKPVFDHCEHIVSFIGLPRSRAELVGVYRVGARHPGPEGVVPRGCPRASWQQGRYFYELERVKAFDALSRRAVIDWGTGTRAWHQRARNKSVVEVRAPGFWSAPFTDYLDFTLSFSELRHLVQHAEANAEWRARLAAVAGVYLVLDSRTGHQYVGSATGVAGLWGRWEQYAKTGHGGNARLKALTRQEGYPEAFTLSVLQVVPRTATRAEVLELERRYKAKLGTLATGLNDN